MLVLCQNSIFERLIDNFFSGDHPLQKFLVPTAPKVGVLELPLLGT